MDPDTPTTDDDDIRDAHGRYRPGHTGNPLGRPPGSRRVLGLARALAAAGVVAVVLDPRRSTRPTSAAARRPRGIAA